MHPVRKENRLADYNYSQPGDYFITVCTKERANILSAIVGGDAHIAPCTALTTVGKTAEKYIKTIPGIDRYVIMPNHVHMILRISAKDARFGPVWENAPTEASISTWCARGKLWSAKKLEKAFGRDPIMTTLFVMNETTLSKPNILQTILQSGMMTIITARDRNVRRRGRCPHRPAGKTAVFEQDCGEFDALCKGRCGHRPLRVREK